MVSREELLTFRDDAPPPGESPFVPGAGPERGAVLVDPDPRWAEQAEALMAGVREALGDRVLELEHVGSTAVPGLAAKPLLDLCLVVADPDDEGYVTALPGWWLRIREPWWYGHRLLRHDSPRANLHVFGPDCAEVARMLLFRDWLRAHPQDRDRYAEAKRAAARAAEAGGETVQQYNARKQQVLREVLVRALDQAP